MNTPSKSILRLVTGLPVPGEGEDPIAWLVDLTGPELTRRLWGSNCPYKYSAAATWVRLAMGTDKRRVDKTLKVLADWAYRYREGDLHDTVHLPHGADPVDVANLLVATAVMVERGTPLIIVTVYPGGHAEFWSARYPQYLLTTPHIDHLPAGWAA